MPPCSHGPTTQPDGVVVALCEETNRFGSHVRSSRSAFHWTTAQVSMSGHSWPSKGAGCRTPSLHELRRMQSWFASTIVLSFGITHSRQKMAALQPCSSKTMQGS